MKTYRHLWHNSPRGRLRSGDILSGFEVTKAIQVVVFADLNAVAWVLGTPMRYMRGSRTMILIIDNCKR